MRQYETTRIRRRQATCLTTAAHGMLCLLAFAFFEANGRWVTTVTPWVQSVGAFAPVVIQPRIPTSSFPSRDQNCHNSRAVLPCKGMPFPRQAGSLTKTVHASSLSAMPMELAYTLSGAYGTALLEHPLPTKSLTAGILCGIGDVLAQSRGTNEDSTSNYNLQRTLRFASKGCLGGILWTFWYDQIDSFLRFQEDIDQIGGDGSYNHNKISLYVLTGSIFSVQANASFLAFCKAHTAAVTTLMSILMEQFLWCPLVYGTFEIPISTLMNGGSVGSIRGEVTSKLNGLLVSNAKVWTLANLLIYNAPLEWRLFIGNVIDIFWQSIVADVSADCGGLGQEECGLDGTETTFISAGEEKEIEAAMMASSTAPVNDRLLQTIE